MKRHLVFSDLDGTLLDHHTYSSDAAQHTLRQLKRAGIPVILNTSKTVTEVEDILRKLSLSTPFIVENGAAIYIPKNTFSAQPKETEIQGNYWVKSFSAPRQYWLDMLLTHCDSYQPFFKGFSTLSDESLSTITGLTLTQAQEAKQRQYGEPIHWVGDDKTKKVFIQHLLSLGANIVQGGRFIHVGDHCDKGKALTWLAEQYQREYQLEDKNGSISTIALGDGDNDIAMLQVADIAIQIRSPVHEFPQIKLYKKSPPIQTTLYGPEGWAEAINNLLGNQFTYF